MRERVQARLQALGGPEGAGRDRAPTEADSERVRLTALWRLYRLIDGVDSDEVPVPLDVVIEWNSTDAEIVRGVAPWTARWVRDSGPAGDGLFLRDGRGSRSASYRADSPPMDLRSALDRVASRLLDPAPTQTAAPTGEPSQDILRRALERVIGRAMPGVEMIEFRRWDGHSEFLTGPMDDMSADFAPDGYGRDAVFLQVQGSTGRYELPSLTTHDACVFPTLGQILIRRTTWESALAAVQAGPASADPVQPLWLIYRDGQPGYICGAVDREEARRFGQRAYGPSAEIRVAGRDEFTERGWSDIVATLQRRDTPIGMQAAIDQMRGNGVVGLPDFLPRSLPLSPANREAIIESAVRHAYDGVGLQQSPLRHAGVAATQAELAARAAAPMPPAPQPAGRFALLEIDPDQPGEAEARARYIAEETERASRRRHRVPKWTPPVREPAPPAERFALLEPREEPLPVEPARPRKEPADTEGEGAGHPRQSAVPGGCRGTGASRGDAAPHLHPDEQAPSEPVISVEELHPGHLRMLEWAGYELHQGEN